VRSCCKRDSNPVLQVSCNLVLPAVSLKRCSDTAGSTNLQLTCRTGFESRLQQPRTRFSFSTVYSTVPALGDWVLSLDRTMRNHLHVGESLGGGSVHRTLPYALTCKPALHTFDETQRYQLCHYDVVVAQLVALGFIMPESIRMPSITACSLFSSLLLSSSLLSSILSSVTFDVDIPMLNTD
jgi:hypothetical protein